MSRICQVLLQVALLLAAINALAMVVRMLAASVLPVQWFWGGALAALAAPALLALALHLSTRQDSAMEVVNAQA